MSDTVHDAEDYVLITESDINEANRPGEEPEIISQIKAWLGPTEFESDTSEYRKHLNAHVQGTGQWILETDQYKRWHETDAIGDLWIRGIPGSGKSVVAANLIRELKTHEDVPVLFFFFRQIILSNRTPLALLRDCSFQLLDYSPLLQSSLKRTMKKYDTVDQVPYDELFKSFASALSAMAKVYCVVDALDEMDLGQDSFLADFLNLGRRYPKSVKLALTSRQLPYLEAHFKGSCLVDLRLDRINVDNDIATYISHRLNSFQGLIMPDEAESIKIAICDRGKGLFLYARLMMDECIRDPKRFLSQKLPNGLGNMYSDLLLEHATRSGATQDFQKLLLEWVTHSQRPMRLIELTAVINSMPGRGGLTDAQDTKNMIRSCCGPLLEVCENEVVQIIHHSFTEFLCGSELSHVQMADQDTIRFPVLDSGSTHTRISIACIKYLKSGCLESWTVSHRCSSKDERSKHDQYHDCYSQGRYRGRGPDEISQLTLDYNFLPYAAEYWPIHATKEDGIESELSEALDEFLCDEDHDYESWKDVWSGLITHTPKNFTPLHLSAHCGLKGYTETLLGRGMDVNIADGLLRTPLAYASINGHHAIVKLLLEHGANHDVVDGLGLSPLLHSAKSGHAKALETLLSSGADPLAEKTKEDSSFSDYSISTKGNTALFYICESGYIDALLVLLKYLDLEKVGSRPIHWAAEMNQPAILAALLEYPPIASHLDDRDNEGNTAIYLASRTRDPKTVRALLNAKADVRLRSYAKPKHTTLSQKNRANWVPNPLPRISPKHSFTPLHGWARLDTSFQSNTGDGSELDLMEVLNLLISAGCEIDAQDELGRTALFGWNNSSYASRKHQELLVSGLLRQGANAKSLDFTGGSVLHEMHGNAKELKAVSLLVDAGADINLVRKSDGRTPLIHATQKYQVMSPTIFRDLGADFNKQDKDGNTAFHYACSSWCMKSEHVDLWLSLADITIQNNAGCLAMTHFAWGNGGEGRVSALKKMIELGLDIETRDHLGRTPLLHLFCNRSHGNEVFLKELLKLGASAKAKDDQGKSALHLLATCQLSWRDKEQDIQLKYETMESLISAGCKINARDNAGNNCFHDAISWNVPWANACSSAIAITKLGVDITSTNHKGRSALHCAAALADDGSVAKTEGSAGTHLDFVLRPDLMFNVNMVDLEGISPLHLAAETSEINVWKLIQAGAQIYATDIYGRTPLHFASAAGKCNIVDLLASLYVEKSLSLDATDVKGRTPLMEAARSGNRDSVVSLMLAGADVKFQDNRLRTPLHAAAEFEHTPHARIEQRKFDSKNHLLKPSRGPPDWRNHQGSAFDKMEVVKRLGSDESQIREVVRLFLAAGADPAHLDINEHTPSDVAVMLGNAPVVHELAPYMARIYSSSESELQPLDAFGEMLLSAVDKNFINLLKDLDFGTDPFVVLERAISYGNDLIIELIKARKLSLVNADGKSPLHLVARLGMTALMEKLLPLIDDINAFSPPLLHAAVQRASTNTEMLHILINAGANVDAIHSQDGKDFSVLHVLARGSHWWFAKALALLLDAGADTEIANEEGKSALQVALSRRAATYFTNGYPEYVGFWGDQTLDVLLNGGAKINTVSPKGLTPLNIALASRRGQHVLQKLLDHGADGGFGPIPAISSAIDSQDIVSLRLLLQAGANPNLVYEAVTPKRHEVLTRLETPLFNAASTDFKYANIMDGRGSSMATEIQSNMVDLLLKYGADPLQPLNNGSTTVLHDISGVNGLISAAMLKGIDLETQDAENMTPLLRACNVTPPFKRAIEVEHAALILIHNGANVHAVDMKGWGSIHHAVARDLPETVKVLLENGASPLVKNNDGVSPFFHAFVSVPHDGRNIKRWAIELLLKAGADPTERFPGGTTALHYLAPCLMERSSRDNSDSNGCYGLSENPTELIAYKELYNSFITLGCDPEAADDKGNTPIFAYVAARKPYNEVSANNPPDEKDHVEMFEKHDIFKVNLDGDGLLHVVAKREEGMDGDGMDGVTLFKMLVERGLDPRLENKKGVTPLDVAAACENELVLDLFARKD